MVSPETAGSETSGIPQGVGGPPAPSRCAALRALLDRPQATVVVGAVNALAARLVERAGFDCCFVTGAGLANSQFGLPDIGLVSMTEVVDEAARICDAVDIPVIVDADTGFGGPLSVMRTVHLLEKAGAAAVQIEDQAMPKRCGHFAGQRLVEPAEMLSRIDAALSARADPDLVVIARTDARSVLGFDEAMRRARLYAEAGADVIFVEAPRTVEEIRGIPAELGGTPVLLNVVEGGKTPQLPREELQEMGYRLILHANLLLRVMLKAGEDALAHLYEHGDSVDLGDRVLGWAQRQALVDLERFDDLENRLSNESIEQ
ncbi:MAG: oxaloacetate decarboxylase [bacterium]|nr:oxaloacetate decarboxylase [bacterium]